MPSKFSITNCYGVEVDLLNVYQEPARVFQSPFSSATSSTTPSGYSTPFHTYHHQDSNDLSRLGSDIIDYSAAFNYHHNPIPLSLSTPTQAKKTRKFHCKEPGCFKSFLTSGHLTRHRVVHTKERNFSCLLPGCFNQFSRRDNMLQHYRSHFTGNRKSKMMTSATPV
jgi:uncharacterized Zn-finger protein